MLDRLTSADTLAKLSYFRTPSYRIPRVPETEGNHTRPARAFCTVCIHIGCGAHPARVPALVQHWIAAIRYYEFRT